MSDNLQLIRGGTMAFTSGALANGTSPGTVQLVSPVTYTIDGVLASRAAINNVNISVTVPPVYGQPADGSFTGQVGGSTRLYGIYLNLAGGVTVLPGQIVSTAELAAGVSPLQFPQPVRNLCCIGVARIALTQGTTFVPGTTLLNAAGVTTTFINLSMLPAEPLRA